MSIEGFESIKLTGQLAADGELHQIAAGEHPAFTTNQGVALFDN